MRKYFLPLIIIAAVAALLFVVRKANLSSNKSTQQSYWALQSIDTVKNSRDVAREKANEPKFVNEIDKEMENIASTGATHVAIGTPYDKEFVPFMKEWIDSARKHGLKIWFRGNFSGWEEWFGYKRITRDEHKTQLKQFIVDNGDLFEDGDIFTSCTECENGGPGDPRHTGDVAGFRQFLIDEYQVSRSAFHQIGKNVSSNYFPMNGDVAKLVMDKTTTNSLGGIVVIDHYVATPELTAKGLADIAKSSGGKVVLGEFGAPIPDIHGDMTEAQQADWITRTLELLSQMPEVVGVNYWANVNSSTALWSSSGTPKKAVDTLKSFYTPNVFQGKIVDETGAPVTGIEASAKDARAQAETGKVTVVYVGDKTQITITAPGFDPVIVTPTAHAQDAEITLIRQHPDLSYRIRRFIHKFI